MWSHLYWYYEIRGNAAYGLQLPTHIVLKALEDTGVLEMKSSQTYCNKGGFPWISVIAVNSNNGSYGLPEHFNSEQVNLIAVVGSKSAPENEQFYIKLLTGIAGKINWEFILEGDDDGNENVVLRAIVPGVN